MIYDVKIKEKVINTYEVTYDEQELFEMDMTFEEYMKKKYKNNLWAACESNEVVSDVLLYETRDYLGIEEVEVENI